MPDITTFRFVRFHIEASLDALGLLSVSERAELSLDLAASLIDMAHGDLADTLPPEVSLDLLRGVSELRACAISERNRRASLGLGARVHAS
jgi:hypothetical protein